MLFNTRLSIKLLACWHLTAGSCVPLRDMSSLPTLCFLTDYYVEPQKESLHFVLKNQQHRKACLFPLRIIIMVLVVLCNLFTSTLYHWNIPPNCVHPLSPLYIMWCDFGAQICINRLDPQQQSCCLQSTYFFGAGKKNVWV